jgi:hypothetical protein
MGTLEALLYALVAAAALALLSFGLRRSGLRSWPLVGLLALFLTAAALLFEPARRPLAEATPRPRDEEAGFVSSNACRACHPGEYGAWHRSYHRTMTQVATPAAVLGDFGDFDGVEVVDRGRVYRLARRGDELVVDLIAPRWDAAHEAPSSAELAQAPRISATVVMTTGSHHLPTGSGILAAAATTTSCRSCGTSVRGAGCRRRTPSCSRPPPSSSPGPRGTWPASTATA